MGIAIPRTQHFEMELLSPGGGAAEGVSSKAFRVLEIERTRETILASYVGKTTACIGLEPFDGKWPKRFEQGGHFDLGAAPGSASRGATCGGILGANP